MSHELSRTEQESWTHNTIGTYVKVVLVNSWIIVLMVILGLFGTYLYVDGQRPLYQAESSVVVGVNIPAEADDYLRGIDVLRPDILGTYIQILRSNRVIDNAYKSLATTYDRELLEAAEIEVTPVENSMVAVITVVSENPMLARDLANEIAVQAIGLNPVEAFLETFPLQVLDVAQTPTEPIFPVVAQSFLFGGAASLILGVGLAFFVDMVANRRQLKRA